MMRSVFCGCGDEKVWELIWHVTLEILRALGSSKMNLMLN